MSTGPQLVARQGNDVALADGPASRALSTLQRHGVFTYDALKAADHAHRPALIDGLLYAGSRNILVGRSGLGKTPLLAQLGLCVAAGLPFLGRPVRQGAVLVYDCESPASEYALALERVSRHIGLPGVPDTYYVYSPNWDPRDDAASDAADRREQLAAAVRDLRPALVIVDPLRGLWPAAEAKTENAVEMYDFMKSVTRECGTTWLILHHLRKANREFPVDLATDPDTWLMEAAGSHALINQSDTRLAIDRQDKEQEDRLLLSGIMRHHGRLTPVVLERCFGDDGEACGYAVQTAVTQLPENYRRAYGALPVAFNWAQALGALETTSKATGSAFLRACEGLQLVRREGSRGASIYRKTTAETAELACKAA